MRTTIAYDLYRLKVWVVLEYFFLSFYFISPSGETRIILGLY